MSPAATTSDVEAIFRFNDPDPDITAEDRALFAIAAAKTVTEKKLTLHDLRTANHLPSDSECLHKHGFTVVRNSVDTNAWSSAENIDSIYIPAISSLLKDLTGCKTVLVNNVAFRRKRVKQQADPKFYHKPGGMLDTLAKSMPTDRPFITPFEVEKTIEPARGIHVDYTLTGLRNTIRHCRADFAEAGAEHLRALDDNSPTRGPRVAAYSIWRPLKTVTRDPIAVLDYKTATPSRWKTFEYRSPGYKGEFLLEATAVNAPDEDEADEPKFYYVSEQRPDEVMIIKFADSESEIDSDVAAGCGHGSPAIVGQYGETRESIEARVLAFW